MRICIVIVFVSVLIYSGCVYDYPVLSDKFSAIQKQTLNKHCLGACHVGDIRDPVSQPLALLSLQADSAYQQLLFNHPVYNQLAIDKHFIALVVPYKPDSSFLVTKITLNAPEPDGFGDPMPSRNEHLPQNQIDAIISWINRGAPND